MPLAAVPRYLGEDFSTAAPGHRFSLYLTIGNKDTDKAKTLGTVVTKLGDNDRRLLTGLIKRQDTLAADLVATGQLATLDATAMAPFSSGLGNEHPLENGFAFLNPYGLPYLPGSGIKGVLRRAAQELLPAGPFGGSSSWDESAIRALFGVEDREGAPQRGALIFWDVIPELDGSRLKVEVMTPHQAHYYQGKEGPHDSGSPNPIFFLSVPPGSRFTFHVQCHRSLLARTAPGLLEGGRWQELLHEAFEHAFSWLGFGAKTSVGYGAMAFDQGAAERRQQAAAERVERQRQLEAQAAREAALARMPPLERKILEAMDSHDPGQGSDLALFKAIEAGQFSDDERLAAARRLEELMQENKSWRESSAKKNPLKDKEHQRTLKVMAWLKAGGAATP